MRLPDLKSELQYIVNHLRSLHDNGIAWSDMAVLYRKNFIGKQVTEALKRADIPVAWLQGNRKNDDPTEESIKVITFHSSKGLEFPVVAIPGLGYLPQEGEDENDEIKLMYVGMTRAMERLVMTTDRDSGFVERVEKSLGGVAA